VCRLTGLGSPHRPRLSDPQSNRAKVNSVPGAGRVKGLDESGENYYRYPVNGRTEADADRLLRVQRLAVEFRAQREQ